MKAIGDKYDPNLNIKENAIRCNCSVAAIRHYIKVNGIDRKYDEALKMWKLINEFHQTHKDFSPYRISKELHISQNTVTKYLGAGKPIKDDNGKLSKFDGSKKTNNILSVNDNQQAILNNILTLYVPSMHFDADLTFSKGSFYKKGVVNQPMYKFDKYPQTEDTIELDKIDEVIDDGTLDSIVYDLPYMVKQSWVTVESKIMALYNSFKNADELITTNKEIMALAARKLRKGGILVVKTQDTNIVGKQLWVSQIILNYADAIELKHIDTFILIAKRLMFTKHEKQYRARKAHSYFFVFRK